MVWFHGIACDGCNSDAPPSDGMLYTVGGSAALPPAAVECMDFQCTAGAFRVELWRAGRAAAFRGRGRLFTWGERDLCPDCSGAEVWQFACRGAP